MALATRCPHCQTAFKVANDQLKLHAGLVRCGSCQQTFNAVENLLPGDGQKPVSAPAPAPAPSPVHARPATIASVVTQTTATVPTVATATVVTVPAAASATPVTPVAPDKPVAPARPQVSAAVPAPAAKPVMSATASEVVAESKPESKPQLKPEPKPAPAEHLASLIEPEPNFEQTRIVLPSPVTPVGRFFPPDALPQEDTLMPDSLVPSERPAAVGKPASSAMARPATKVLAAISKAELEFEAETFDMPRDIPPAVRPAVVTPISTTLTTAETQKLEPVLDPLSQHKADPEPAGLKKEPVISSSSALDFDLGDGGFLLPSEEVQEADLTRIELETRAALMDPPTADWSVSEGAEDAADSKEKLPEFTATEIADAHSVSKVWRHKDHADVAAPDDAVSINDEVATADTGSSADGIQAEAYIGEAEAALANQAAINEDSSSDPEEEAAKPNFVIQAEKQRSRKRIANIMLGLMIVLLIPLLLGQSAYIFRNQLATRVPETKPWLQQACKYLSCQVTLPAQIEKIFVDSNELQNLAPERNVFMLVMQIQNQSDVAQTWPNIELVLNDVKDKPLLQRAFTPADYLTEKDKLEKGFAAGGEQNIKLYFELPALKAAGFHVGVFYP
ncbi:MAG: zinc-ribbon domain-containing protein [Burkholderiales bacterium]|nr:zinc-ribbon domain-containing protein [Burkholderiales bacterium]